MAAPFPFITTLNDIQSAAYLQAEQYILGMLQRAFPDMQFSPGSTLYWHVVVPASAAMAAVLANADRIGTSLSIKWLKENPQADEEFAKALLANYYQKLSDGSYATGLVAIYVNNDAALSIPENTVFSSGSKTYVTTQRIFASTNKSILDPDTGRLLERRAENLYAVTVPVRATEKGVLSFLPINTPLTMQNPPQGFIRAVTVSDISGGTDPQSYRDALVNVQESFAAQTYGSNAHLQAYLRSQYPNLKMQLVGIGYEEMIRDKWNPLQISTGGFVDAYVLTQPSLSSKTLIVTAEYLGNNSRQWKFTIPRKEASGAYPTSIIVSPVDSDVILGPVKSVQILYDDSDVIHEIKPPLYGSQEPIFGRELPQIFAHTAYQKLECIVEDNYSNIPTGLPAGTKKDIKVSYFYMPFVDELQTLVSSKSFITNAAHVLIKAATPCVTTISVVVKLVTGDEFTPTEIDIAKQRIIQALYQRSFRHGMLSSSAVIDVIHDYIASISDVSTYSVTLRGDIYSPNNVYHIEGQELQIPHIPEDFVTKNTVAFLTDPTKIYITTEYV